MKKLLLLLLFSMSLNVISQTLLTQNFSSNPITAGWSIDQQTTNWSLSSTANAGGTSPELRMSWTPVFNTTSRFVSPVVNTVGSNTLLLNFKYAIDHYSGPYTIGVATRSNSGVWTNVWSRTGADVVENKTISITNTDVGSATFQFCFYFSGNSYNIDFLYIDDVVLINPANKDLVLQRINIDDYNVPSSIPINFTYANLGLTNISSFEANYQIDGGNVISQNVTGLNLALGNTGNFTFATPWNATSGSYNLNVWLSNINNEGNDDITTNNSLTKPIGIATQTVSKMPFYEEFTSSTCPPCATFNNGSFNAFFNNHLNDANILKYQMNWPAPGDPYYSAEFGSVRRQYYGVSGVPSLYLGGKPLSISFNSSTDTNMLNNSFTTESAKSTFFTITPTYSINGSIVDVNVNVMPFVSGEFTLHVAIFETLTTGNATTNGETSFKHVMMKMLPTAHGSNINFQADTPFSQNFSTNMTGTFTEEMSDLKVVVFIQYNSTKDVMQSAYATLQSASVDENIFDTVKVYPNPSSGLIFFDTEKSINITIYDMLGKEVMRKTDIQNQSSIDLSNLENGLYILNVNDGLRFGTRKIFLNK